jgi:peptide/nickel transport system permease protein
MHRYIVSRLLLVIPTLLGAALLVYILMRLIPGDICMIRLGGSGTSFSTQALAACHAELGLDSPFGITINSLPTLHILYDWLVIAPDRYWFVLRPILGFFDYVWHLARFDFGMSMWSGKPVIQEIATRFPVSLEVSVLATVIAISIAIPLGTISALKQNTWIDLVVRTFSIAGIATPAFWLGILSILLVLDVSQWLTGHPWMPSIDYVPLWKDPLRNLSIVMLPAITVGYRYAAVSMRMTRSAMLEVLREDYIRTARAKGLLEKIVINRHALKNALLPVVTVIGIEFAFLIGGLVVTEQVFNLNGIGRLMVQAVQNQDYTLTQALVMLVVTLAVLSNLVVDLFYAWLDPRIRLR